MNDNEFQFIYADWIFRIYKSKSTPNKFLFVAVHTNSNKRRFEKINMNLCFQYVKFQSCRLCCDRRIFESRAISEYNSMTGKGQK